MNQPLVAIGSVRHRRLHPAAHAFVHRACFVLLPLRAMAAGAPAGALPRNRFGLLSFHDRDHGAGGDDALAWVDGLLQREGVTDATGEVWLQTFPRIVGHAFKPVSMWYCERADGTLAAVLAEVNNTFGERHVYLLDGAGLGWGREQTARKVFHVSPFVAVEGRYRFRFLRRDDRIVLRIDHDDAAGRPLLQTSLAGHAVPATAAALRRAFVALPLGAAGVLARIHWHALRLWLKRVPFHARPAPPPGHVSR